MALPLSISFGLSDDTDHRVDVPRSATAYLAASWQPGGPSLPAGEGRRMLVIPPELVTQIRARDRVAFETFVHLVYVPLVHFARGFVGSRETAEDVVQDVLATVWERGGQWAPAGNPVTYLFGMVRHHAIDALRRRAHESRRHLRIAGDVSHVSEDSPEERILEAEDAMQVNARLRALEELLTTMSERQRTAYDLRYRQGLTLSDVGQVLGITAKSAEQLIGRLVRTIRERMRALEGSPR